MNITFAVFQSYGTTIGSNGLLKLFTTGPGLSCSISCTILGWRLSSPLTWYYLICFQPRWIHFCFRPSFPVLVLLLPPYCVAASSLKTGTNYSSSFWDLPREAFQFSERCMIWNNFNNFLAVFPDRVLQNILLASIPINTRSYSLRKPLQLQIHQKH